MLDVQDLVRRISAQERIDPALALAVAEEESGFRPDAVGDNGCSFGLYQANRCGGAGTGIPVDALIDPDFNTRQFAQRIHETAASGSYATPGELAAAAQRPYDPRAYADAVNALYRKYVATGPAAAAAPVHPADAERGTVVVAPPRPDVVIGDIASAAAAAPAKVVTAVGGKVAGAAVDHFRTQLIVVLAVLVLVILVVGVLS